MSLRKVSRGFAVGYVLAGITFAMVVGTVATKSILSVLEASKKTSAVGQVTNQMSIISKQIIADAVDADGDDLNEPPKASQYYNNATATVITAAAKALPTTLADGGKIYTAISTSHKDPWGSEIVYCPWDHGTFNAADDKNYFQGKSTTDVTQSDIIFGLISLGPDKTRQTSCGDLQANKPKGDDIFKRVTLAEVQQLRLRGDQCTDAQISVYNKESGQFECRDIGGLDPNLDKVDVCSSLGMVYNGTQCVFGDDISALRREPFAQIKLDFGAIGNSSVYRDIDIKDGRVVVGMNSADTTSGNIQNHIITSSRTRYGGYWAMPAIMDTTNSAEKFGYRVGIYGSSQFSGEDKRKSQLFILTPDTVSDVNLKRYRLYQPTPAKPNYREWTSLFPTSLNNNKGVQNNRYLLFYDNTIDKRLTTFTLPGPVAATYTNTSYSIGGGRNYGSLSVWSNKLTDGKSYVAIGAPDYNSNRGRVKVYSFDTNVDLANVDSPMQLLNTYDSSNVADAATVSGRFGAALSITNEWLVVKSMATSAGITNNGKLYFFKNSNAATPGTAFPNTVTQAVTTSDMQLGTVDAYPENIKNLSLSGEWVVNGEPNDDTYGTNAGAIVILKNENDVWSMIKKVYSPYRATNTTLNTNNYFGNNLALDNKMLAVSEPGYYTTATGTSTNYRTDAYGLIYLFVNTGDTWAPYNVYGKHHYPATNSGNNVLLQRWVMGPVAVDGSSGEVAFFMAFDGNDNSGSFFPAGEPGTPFWFAGVYGPYKGIGTTLFSDDMDDFRETCPSITVPYRASTSTINTGSLGITFSDGKCFADYNPFTQVWTQ